MNKQIMVISDFLKERPILTSIILFDMITLSSFIINPVRIFYSGDLDFIFGSIVGLYYAMKNKTEKQSIRSTIFTITIIGGLLAALTITIYEYNFYILLDENLNTPFLVLLLNNSVFTTILGLLIGIISLILHNRKHKKRLQQKSVESTI